MPSREQIVHTGLAGPAGALADYASELEKNACESPAVWSLDHDDELFALCAVSILSKIVSKRRSKAGNQTGARSLREELYKSRAETGPRHSDRPFSQNSTLFLVALMQES